MNMHRTPASAALAAKTLAPAVLALALLGGCAAAPEETLADGSALRELIAQQTHDPGASARHGTTAPEGTDPDVANAAVQAVRSNSGRETPGAGTRGSMLDIITGSRSR